MIHQIKSGMVVGPRPDTGLYGLLETQKLTTKTFQRLYHWTGTRMFCVSNGPMLPLSDQGIQSQVGVISLIHWVVLTTLLTTDDTYSGKFNAVWLQCKLGFLSKIESHLQATLTISYR